MTEPIRPIDRPSVDDPSIDDLYALFDASPIRKVRAYFDPQSNQHETEAFSPEHGDWSELEGGKWEYREEATKWGSPAVDIYPQPRRLEAIVPPRREQEFEAISGLEGVEGVPSDGSTVTIEYDSPRSEATQTATGVLERCHTEYSEEKHESSTLGHSLSMYVRATDRENREYVLEWLFPSRYIDEARLPRIASRNTESGYERRTPARLGQATAVRFE